MPTRMNQVTLVDTHVFVWLAFDQARLSGKARAAINDARPNGQGLAISDITLLELATLSNQGRMRPGSLGPTAVLLGNYARRVGVPNRSNWR
jgi:PIN domain nuclease of toxin-antitoxin system